MKKNSISSERMLLRITEAAEIIAISRAKFYELIRSGEIPIVKIGSAARVRVDDLHSWVNAQGCTGGSI